MGRSPTLVLREARRIPLRVLARRLGVGEGGARRLVARLGLVESIAARGLEAAGLVAREARPMCILERGGETLVYTGDWVGVAVVEASGHLYTVILEPKVENFYDMLVDALGRLESLGLHALHARIASILAEASALNHPGVIAAARFIEDWAAASPPTPEAHATIMHMVYALAAAASRLSRLGAPPTVTRLALEAVTMLAYNPRVAHALYSAPAADPDPEPVIETVLLSRASILYTARGELRALTTLIPSPKMFEVIVLAHTLEALAAAGCRVTSIDANTWTLRLDCRGRTTSVYFNRAPRSKLVEPLSGHRLHPDIVVEVSDKLVVIEAKYRVCRGACLGLGDAARIASYAADLEPDAILVVYPVEPAERRAVGRVVEISVEELRGTLTAVLAHEGYETNVCCKRRER